LLLLTTSGAASQLKHCLLQRRVALPRLYALC
jgi:hypothetical protein